MTTRISINGTVRDADSAQISVLDRGFLYGDSVYEVLRSYAGRLFALQDHLARLQRSAELTDIALPISLQRMADEIEATVADAGNPESYVRVVITRGAGPIGLDPALAVDPQRVIIVTELQRLPADWYHSGVKVQLVAAGRAAGGALPAAAKSGNYLTNLLALRIARQQGAHEAVMLDAEGRIAEGSTSNVFAVVAGQLLTPALHIGLLEGITRAKVIALAKHQGLVVRETELHESDLRRATELFLTSTLRELLPITQVNDWTVGDGQPGPVTRSLQRAFDELTRGVKR